MFSCRFRMFFVLTAALVGFGCSKPSPETNAGGTASTAISELPPAEVVPPALPPLVKRADLDLRLPGEDASFPEWIGQRDDDPFPVREFLESRQSPENNAAPLYLQVLAPFEEMLKVIYPADERESRGAEAAERQRQILEYAGYKPRPQARVTPPEVHQLLTDVEPLLYQIDQAQQLGPCVFVSGMRATSITPHLGACRDLARLGRMEIEFVETPEQLERTFQTIRRMLKLSRDIRLRGFLVTQLVSYAMDAITLHSIVDFLLPREDLTVEHCDRLLQLVSEHKEQGIDSFQEAARMEYIMLRNSIEDLAAGRTTIDELNLGLTTTANVRGLINYDVERAETNRMFSLVLEDSQVPYHKVISAPRFTAEVDKLRDQFAAAPADVLTGGKLQRSLICPMLLPAMDQAREAAARYQVRMGAIPAIIAVRRYQLVHGDLPKSLLDALAEVGISDIPIDSYDGKPLKYVIVEGRPIVYAISWDLEDQGGLVDWDFKKQPGDFLFTYFQQ